MTKIIRNHRLYEDFFDDDTFNNDLTDDNEVDDTFDDDTEVNQDLKHTATFLFGFDSYKDVSYILNQSSSFIKYIKGLIDSSFCFDTDYQLFMRMDSETNGCRYPNLLNDDSRLIFCNLLKEDPSEIFKGILLNKESDTNEKFMSFDIIFKFSLSPIITIRKIQKAIQIIITLISSLYQRFKNLSKKQVRRDLYLDNKIINFNNFTYFSQRYDTIMFEMLLKDIPSDKIDYRETIKNYNNHHIEIMNKTGSKMPEDLKMFFPAKNYVYINKTNVSIVLNDFSKSIDITFPKTSTIYLNEVLNVFYYTYRFYFNRKSPKYKDYDLVINILGTCNVETNLNRLYFFKDYSTIWYYKIKSINHLICTHTTFNDVISILEHTYVNRCTLNNVYRGDKSHKYKINPDTWKNPDVKFDSNTSKITIGNYSITLDNTSK